MLAYGLKARCRRCASGIARRITGGPEEEVLEYVDKSYKDRDEQAAATADRIADN